MEIQPEGIDEHVVAEAVARGWRVGVEHVTFDPRGFGGYHWRLVTSDGARLFVTVDDLDAKPWLGSDRDVSFAGLQAAYGTATRLREGAGLTFVVAPERDRDGEVVRRLSEQHCLAVFPFVPGEAGRWGDPIDTAGRRRLVERLAELHRATPLAASSAPRRPVEVPARAELDGALDDLRARWATGPFGEPARLALAERADDVRARLAAFDAGARVASAAPDRLVVTHGEPHPGNLLRADDGVRLVDWDTVDTAAPERDLWMLVAGDEGAADDVRAVYRAATVVELDDGALALFRQAWGLTDLAAFVRLFRSPHRRTADTEKAWRGLTSVLAGDPPPPFGPPDRRGPRLEGAPPA